MTLPLTDIAPYYIDGSALLLAADVRAGLRALPAESVHAVVTSPPYWALRDYGLPPTVWGPSSAHPELVEGCEHLWGAERTAEGYTGTARWQHSENGRGEEQIDDEKRLRAVQRVGAHSTLGGGGKSQIEGKLVDVIRRSERPEAWGQVSNGAFCQHCGSWRGSLGLEPHPDLYIAHLVDVMREVRRVLRNDGSLWLNIGDSFSSGGKGGGGSYMAERKDAAWSGRSEVNGWRSAPDGLKPLDMVGIPWALAFALRADGWYLRADVIWAKPNPMPSSVDGWRWERHRVRVAPSARAAEGSAHTEAYNVVNRPQGARDGREFADHAAELEDCPGCPKCAPNDGLVLRKGSWRPTVSHEYLFLLTKRKHYYADAEAVTEAVTGNAHHRGNGVGPKTAPAGSGIKANASFHAAVTELVGSRNRRSVWTIATQRYRGAHFATFPEELARVCIAAGTSEAGCCEVCGAPWARVETPKSEIGKSEKPPSPFTLHPSLFFRPTCRHRDAAATPCIVLDPFLGSGTTAKVALQMGRHAIGIDLSEQYLRLARKRIAAPPSEPEAVAAHDGSTGSPRTVAEQLGMPLWAAVRA